MAKEETSPTSMRKVYFPLLGYSKTFAYSQQPSLTTPLCLNVRLTDVSEKIARGGTRPGLVKAYTTQVGGAYPIVKICSITTTYLEST